MSEERVSFESGDRVALSGIYRESEGGPRAGIVLAHGIMVDKDFGGFYPALAAELARTGFASLRFDFRGHGESGGAPEAMTIEGEVKDLGAAVRFLRTRRLPRVGIVGTSLGAAIAVLCAARARRPPFALVLLSSILDFRRAFLHPETPWAKERFTPRALAEAHASGILSLGGFRLGAALLREFETVSPAEVLGNLALPVLIVHGDGDPIAPFRAALDASGANPRVRFVRVQSTGHYFEGSEAHVFRQVSAWLEARRPARE